MAMEFIMWQSRNEGRREKENKCRLVVATKIMSSLVAKFAVEAHAMIDAGGVQSPRALSNDVLAAVTAAVHQYRRDKDRQ